MPPIQKDLGIVGWKKQTAKGSIASTPATVQHGLLSGKVFDAPITQDYEAQTLSGATGSDRFAIGSNRTSIDPGASFQTRAWLRSVGIYLFGALGNNVDSGAGPFIHTITPALSLPYWTLFGKYGASEYMTVQDVLINELTLAWDGRNPLTVDAAWLGTIANTHGSAWTASNDDSVATYLGPNAGTLTLDAGSATPAAAQIKSGSIHIANNLDPVLLSKSLMPDDLVPGQQQIDGTFTIEPNDFSDWLKIFSGTGTGTAAQSTVVYGSFSMLVQIDTNNQLTLAALRVPMNASFPDSDPAGGGMTIDLAFTVDRPTDGSAAFTATLKNQIATNP